ncbi:hypothetical protein RchiOBHm_Chr6g0274031 [Rosa chinensis]|uniref:Uncharacterized protein n=1 Tax=Rosa chinensis TaxID=74649 RepID=A0A2P6PRN4_ROSCH|nr:hypothetical protein RchiOBHm_Chr6g0274031 [Rosa chinensis]
MKICIVLSLLTALAALPVLDGMKICICSFNILCFVVHMLCKCALFVVLSF